MAKARTPVVGLILVGGIAILGTLFGAANWYWLDQRHKLEREGIAATALVDDVTISHKACNSSVRLTWVDVRGATHTQRFITCFANRSRGETIGIRYLLEKPETAMIAEGEGGLSDAHYRTGGLIGAIIGVIMGAITVGLIFDRMRSRSN
jgi:hypothetical protein